MDIYLFCWHSKKRIACQAVTELYYQVWSSKHQTLQAAKIKGRYMSSILYALSLLLSSYFLLAF